MKSALVAIALLISSSSAFAGTCIVAVIANANYSESLTVTCDHAVQTTTAVTPGNSMSIMIDALEDLNKQGYKIVSQGPNTYTLQK